jgi:hypothetical protein
MAGVIGFTLGLSIFAVVIERLFEGLFVIIEAIAKKLNKKILSQEQAALLKKILVYVVSGIIGLVAVLSGSKFTLLEALIADGYLPIGDYWIIDHVATTVAFMLGPKFVHAILARVFNYQVKKCNSCSMMVPKDAKECPYCKKDPDKDPNGSG